VVYLGTIKYQDLQLLEKSQITAATELMASAFINYPMFTYLVPDPQQRRQFLKVIYRSILEHDLGAGGVYCPSAALEGLICPIMPGDRRASLHSAWTFCKRALVPLKLLGKTPLWPLLRRFTKFWQPMLAYALIMKQFRQALVISQVAVNPTVQRQKWMSKMMRAVLARADATDTRCVLETEDEINVQIYRHFGFELYSTIEAIPDRLYLYVMIYTPQTFSRP
jgi:ribosomal protein S18 acetylase RimI-like enzyme